MHAIVMNIILIDICTEDRARELVSHGLYVVVCYPQTNDKDQLTEAHNVI